MLSKVSKGKKCVQSSQRNQAQGSSPRGVTRWVFLQQGVVTTHEKFANQASSLETECPGFVLMLVPWAPSSWYGAKFQAPRRMQFSINHTLCANSLGTLRHPYLLGWWEPSWNLRSQMPAKGQPCKQAIPRLHSQIWSVKSSLHNIIGHKASPNSLASFTILPSSWPGLPPTKGHIPAAKPCLCACCCLCLRWPSPPWKTKSSLFSSLKTLSQLPSNVLLLTPSFSFHFSVEFLSLKLSSLLIFHLFTGISYTWIKLHEGRKTYLSYLLCCLQYPLQDWQIVSAQLIFVTQLLRITVK